jgi:hypothetical protein
MKVTLKEFSRHVLHKAGALEPLRKMRHGKIRRGEGATLQERFVDIYDSGVWQTSPDTPLSGAGSAPAVAERLGAQLPSLVAELGATSFADVGCGDFVWMKDVDLGCPYLGLDIVPSVIAANQSRFGSDVRSFALCNAVSDPLPTAEIVLCREILFHLSFADARALLANVVRSKARWLLATTDPMTGFNADIESGDFRVINLCAAPFGFPEANRQLMDDALVPGRYVGVWDISRLPQWTRGA